MKQLFILFLLFCSTASATQVVWTTPSRNSSESMPCGGGDIGLNVWVEDGDLLFYVSRSGTFDANSTQLKQGRFRLKLVNTTTNNKVTASTNNPISEKNAVSLKSVASKQPIFRQELKLNDGYVEVACGGTTVQLWVDVFRPVVHVEIVNRTAATTMLSYENWRYRNREIRKGEGQQGSYKWAPPKGTLTTADSIAVKNGQLVFFHRNPAQTVFDFAVAQQGLDGVKSQLMNPLAQLTFGGCLLTDGLTYKGTTDGTYAGTDYRAWHFHSPVPMRKQQLRIVLHTEQTARIDQWKQGLNRTCATIDAKHNKQQTRQWWNAFWQRSFIEVPAGSQAESIVRNYTLFRYMLGCNAYGSTPTKFNGGLFTFDPCFVDEKQAFTPDYRKWGGGTMTAQNQRLVYWPMLKSGDADMMPAQFDFYLRMLRNAELRSETYWGHGGACFVEQIENFGLPNPAEYGYKRPDWFDRGMEYNAWLEYEWDTVLEFCQMILETHSYANADIDRYVPLIESSLRFFDEHYRYLATRRGRKALDGEGHLILFPGSACETYKMTNNASSTIAALRTVLETYQRTVTKQIGSTVKQPTDSTWLKMAETIPPLPFRKLDGRQMIAPAKAWERINNTETPQLYPVFPWRIYGVGKEGLEVARNTYLHDPDAVKFRSHDGWKQDHIWAACLGLTDEARRLALLKLGDGPHRFPAFWGPSFDWTPDHNRGGSGMIGLQEMLLQTNGNELLLFAAWPKEWDVRFKLHAPGGTVIEAELKSGKVVLLNVTPQSRRKDIKICLNK